MLAFLLGASGQRDPRDSFLAFEQLTTARKQAVLDYVHARGAKIMLSIGGATDHVDGGWNGDTSGLIYSALKIIGSFCKNRCQKIEICN